MTRPANGSTPLISRAQLYAEQLKEHTDAMAYLTEERKLTPETLERFGVGMVTDPTPEDKSYRGRISIPYLHWSRTRGANVSAIRFRAFGHGGAKYLGHPGVTTDRFFNPSDFDTYESFICVTEGEFDCMSAYQCGLPAVGLPGATQWCTWMKRLFVGFDRIYILADGDKAGKDMTDAIAKDVPNVHLLPMEVDVNADYVKYGESYIKEMVRL